MEGKKNLGAGFLMLAVFMAYGFMLVYLRDLSPQRVDWIGGYASGAHAEARMAHVHGALFAFLNIVIGYLLMRLAIPTRSRRWISWLALAGLLMPVGILLKLALSVPPLPVLLGAVSMVLGVAWLGLSALALPAEGFSRK